MAKKQETEAANDFPRAISNPARNALMHAGYTRLAELTQLSEKQLAAMHGVGPVAIARLKVALAEIGLSLAPDAK
jgi:hypothetical protein